MIRLENVSRTFNAGTPDERRAIDAVSLEVAKGEFIAVIGGNGAGKSTLLGLVSGALTPDAGRVLIGDEDVTALPQHQRARRIARVFQDPMTGTAPTLTVEENLALAELRAQGRGWRAALSAARRSRYRDALAPLGLGLEERLTARAGLLSGGQRQALALVMATLIEPQVLLLDEHTAALDPRTSASVMQSTVELIGGRSLTTLMVTHNMEHALRYGSRIVMMSAGRIPADLSAQEKRDLSVADLGRRFHVAEDRMVLA